MLHTMKYYIINEKGEVLLRWGDVPDVCPVAVPGSQFCHNLGSWHQGFDAIAFGTPAATVEQAFSENGTTFGQGADLTCPEWQWFGLRDAWLCLSKPDFDAAVHAAMWVHWDRTTRFCPVCGKSLVRVEELTKRCPECGKEYYPQIAPAVIVRVDRGALTLLARAALRPKFFGLVSGFVEGGETFEECVARELMEETGIKVADIRYFGSQSWPFPSGIMVGYTAKYESGEICLNDGELLEAGFYSRSEVREMNIPKPFSISRQLIDAWLNAGEQPCS